MEGMVVVVDERLHVDEEGTHDEVESPVEMVPHEMDQKMDFVYNKI